MRLATGRGASWTREAAAGAPAPAPPAEGLPIVLDPALAPPSPTGARRGGAQPRPILVKGDLRRFPSPPGVEAGPLRIQACPLQPAASGFPATLRQTHISARVALLSARTID